MSYVVVMPFTVKTKQGDLTLNPGQTVILVEEKAQKLITEGKIKPLDTSDQFTELFNSAVNEINRHYVPGAIAYSRKTFSKFYQKTLEAENRINKLWNDGTDLNTFKLAVNEWHGIESVLIILFQKDKQN